MYRDALLSDSTTALKNDLFVRHCDETSCIDPRLLSGEHFPDSPKNASNTALTQPSRGHSDPLPIQSSTTACQDTLTTPEQLFPPSYGISKSSRLTNLVLRHSQLAKALISTCLLHLATQDSAIRVLPHPPTRPPVTPRSPLLHQGARYLLRLVSQAPQVTSPRRGLSAKSPLLPGV